MPVHWKNFFLPGTVFFPGQRNSTIPDLWFQVGFCFCFVFFFMSIIQHQVHFNLQHNLAMTWFSCQWCPFDADCANHMFFFSEMKEKYGFCALTSPPLCWEAMLDILNCSVKQGSESNYFSHMLEACSPFWILGVVPKPFPSRVLALHHLLCSYFCHTRSLNAAQDQKNGGLIMFFAGENTLEDLF